MSSSELYSICNIWFLILEGQHIDVILNVWKERGNLKRKNNRDTNEGFVEVGWEGAWEKMEGRCLAII